MVFECLYSAIFEFNDYLKLFSSSGDGYSGYDINISGTFVSKNDFGAFLIMGLVSERFLSLGFKHKKNMRIVLLAGRIMFLLITILSLCKTALFSVALILLIDAFFSIKRIIKERSKKGFIVLGSLISFALISTFVLIVFKNNAIIGRVTGFIESKLNDAFIKSFSDRIFAWAVSFNSSSGINVVIGVPKAILPSLILINSGNTVVYPHNGFVYQYLNYGIFGLLLLFFAYYLIAKRINNTSDKSDKRVLYTTLLVGIMFMMTESEILIISSSELVFLFNVILCHNFKTINSKEVELYYEIIEI